MPDPSDPPEPKSLREERLGIEGIIERSEERSEEWLIGQYTVGLSVCLDDDGAPVVHIDGDLEGLRVNVNDAQVHPVARSTPANRSSVPERQRAVDSLGLCQFAPRTVAVQLAGRDVAHLQLDEDGRLTKLSTLVPGPRAPGDP